MTVFFDQGTPVPLRLHLRPHQVDTAAERGWGRLKNDELLRRIAAEGYSIFISTDQGLHHQQKLSRCPFGVVILGTTSWPRIRERVEDVRQAIATVKPGTVIFIDV